MSDKNKIKKFNDKENFDLFPDSKKVRSRNNKQRFSKSLKGTFNTSSMINETKNNELYDVQKSKTILYIPKLNMKQINYDESIKNKAISYEKYKYIFEEEDRNVTASSARRRGSKSRRVKSKSLFTKEQ